MLERLFDISFLKFLCVGVINTLFGLSVIYGAKWFLGWNDVYANLTGYICGFLVSYFLNSRWTFNNRNAGFNAFIRYAIIIIGAYFLNLFIVLAAINVFDLNSYVAQALGVPPYTLTVYFLSRFFVFSSNQSAVSPIER